MKIWIDADACPRVIKEIVFRASVRLEVPVCLVANQYLSKSHSDLVTSVRVDAGFDNADEHIVRGGPAQLGLQDRQRFASALDRLLTRMLKDGH